MLVSVDTIKNSNIMSLQIGRPIGRLDQPIINPMNLDIVAWYVQDPINRLNPAVIFSSDIREFGELGAIVDSADNIMSPADMIRLQQIINYHFKLIGLPVYQGKNTYIGKINNYSVDTLNFQIGKLFVKPPLWQRLANTGIMIDRRQVIEVAPNRITVENPTEPRPELTEELA